MYIKNFKKELIETLKHYGLTLEDIRWVGTKDIKYNLNIFLNSLDFGYDAGYGWEEINPDLLIVGDNWWLERHEYDGSEWWEFKKHPKEPNNTTDEFDIKNKWLKD